MKRFIFCALVLILMLGLILNSDSKGFVKAQDSGYTVISKVFSLEGGDPGTKIPKGSTIKHLKDGTTEVYNSDNSLLLKARDTETKNFLTNTGYKKASNVINAPSGSLVVNDGKGTVIIYKNQELLGTVIDENISMGSGNAILDSWPSYGNDLIENAYDTGVRADHNYCEWTTPYPPLGPYATTINSIWNGMAPSDGTSIIQPVLEFNVLNYHDWDGVAMYVYDNNQSMVTSNRIPVNTGQRVSGLLDYVGDHKWNIVFTNIDNYGQQTALLAQQTNFGPDDLILGPKVRWALEAYVTYADQHVSSNVKFENISLTKNGNPVSFNLKKDIHTWNFPNLTNLDVTWPQDQSYISLHTALSKQTISTILQGGSRPDSGWVVPETIKFFTPGSDVINGTPLYTYSATTRKSGSTALADVPIFIGNFDTTTVSPTTLLNVRRSVPVLTDGSIDMGTLLGGNANDDFIINIQDFGILAAAYGKQPGQVGWDPRADFDRNLIINIADFGLLAANYGKYSPIEIGSGLLMAQSNLGKANLNLKSALSSITATKMISVDIVVDSGTQSVSGVDAFLKFDPKYLEVISLKPGKSLDQTLAQRFDNTNGTITLSSGTMIPVSGTFTMGTVMFKAKAPTEGTTISFEHKAGRNTEVVYGGSSVLGSATDGKMVIEK